MQFEACVCIYSFVGAFAIFGSLIQCSHVVILLDYYRFVCASCLSVVVVVVLCQSYFVLFDKNK